MVLPPPYKTGFRLRWRAKLAPYPAPIRMLGFTLIELSIVLVIIGLIVGGVLVGQELIRAAQLRAQISQVEKLTTAVHTFQLKYNCLPGDCNNAVSLGLGTNAGWHNGNRDKRVGSFCFTWNVSNANYPGHEEYYNFFLHLSTAGLIEGAYAGYQGEAHATTWDETIAKARMPKAAYGKGFLVASRFEHDPRCGSPAWSSAELVYMRPSSKHGFAVVGVNPGNQYLDDVVDVADLHSVDTKIDDGMAISGNVGAQYSSTYTALSAAADNNNNVCINANGTYTNSTTAKCKMLFLNQY